MRYAHSIGTLKCPEEDGGVICAPRGIHDKPQALSMDVDGPHSPANDPLLDDGRRLVSDAARRAMVASCLLPDHPEGEAAVPERHDAPTARTVALRVGRCRRSGPRDQPRRGPARDELFRTVGKVVRHTRRTLLRLTGAVQLALLLAVRHRIAALAPA